MSFSWRLFFMAAALPLAAQTTIGPGVPVVVTQDQAEPLRRAAADLAADLGKVFGRRSPVVAAAPRAGAYLLVQCCEAKLEGREAALVEARGAGIVLTGSDVRGAIYAVYDFSRMQLGVDPFYYWTDHAPARRQKVTLAAGYRHAPGAPGFRYRGWFINDEDLLTGWRPGNPGISLEAWDKVFETLLRLRGNMIVPGTFIFPDEPQVAAASRRGLIISQHHIEVLGTNTWRWPEEQPYSFATHRQLLMNAWRNAMKTYAPWQEVLWTTGYRGRHDRAFWIDDKATPPTDEARAAAIRAAIDAQVGLVRAERKDPEFIMNAWDEAAPLIHKGVLKTPEGVTLVWPDNGHGLIRDQGRIARGQGVYYHTAMHDFRANQLTEMVPLERIQRELGRAARAGATEYLLVNVSDVRPYVMTTQAVMEIAAAPAGFDKDEFLKRWCREQFGAEAAPRVEELYKAYFTAPGRYGAAEHDTLADTAYHNYLRFILVSIIKGKPELSERLLRVADWDNWLEARARAAREAEPRWNALAEAAGRVEPLIPAGRRTFYQAHVLTQIAIHRHSNRALSLAAEAWKSKKDAPRLIAAAAAELRLVLAAFAAAETGQWQGYYAEDRFTNVRLSLRLAEACQAQLAGKPLPADLEVKPLVPDPYFWLKAYQAKRWVDTR